MIPGYQLEAFLGRGRSSSVYAGRRDGRMLALKVARRADLAFTGRYADFSREFAVANTLAPSCALQVFEHGVAGEHAFLAMEYATGHHLAHRAGTLAATEIFSFMTQAAAALAQLHAQGWVHRDVKPANLLVRDKASLVLGDFGCACNRGEWGQGGERSHLEQGTVIGTPRYAAPEQSQGAAAEPSADVYSLGVVLYELLCGQPPFPGETLTELLCQHLVAPVPALPVQQRLWQPMVDAMLAKDPRQRLADGQAVLDRLQQLRPDFQSCGAGLH
jgi:serine/threonine-protein kinase PpkA